MVGKPKRAAWDVKGRLQDMEAERKSSKGTISNLQDQLSSLAQRLESLEHVKEQHEGTIQAQEVEQSVSDSKIRTLKDDLAAAKQQLLDSARNYEHEIEMLKLQKSALQRSHDQLEAELSASRAEGTSLKATVSQMAADASAIQCQLDATKAARDQALTENRARGEEIVSLKGQVEECEKTITDCQASILEGEMTRRWLHNTIQELKGNIRVFCRVRPLLPSEGGCDLDDTTGSCGSRDSTEGSARQPSRSLEIRYPDQDKDAKAIMLQYAASESSSAKSYDFEFDQVFGPSSSQERVFEDISQLVQSALDGYNVCIFAYGQTGSGKTFTMEGPETTGDRDRRGMIPRAVQQVFASAESLKEQGWTYKMEASFLEIYNESLRDLLSSSAPSDTTKLEIKMDPKSPGEIYVTNLTPTVVTSEAQVSALLERAAKNRVVAATLCNERSSRSHSVFRLRLAGDNEKTGQSCQGTLNLIDLAGSERLSQSGSAGDRLRETKSINKSLSNLGTVIMALANKDQHIPYRNSKLTYLLQNSLGGNSKTLMFVNVSPQAVSFQETLCSLRFATKVNQCNIGTATKKVVK